MVDCSEPPGIPPGPDSSPFKTENDAGNSSSGSPSQNPFVSIWSVDSGPQINRDNMTLQHCDNSSSNINNRYLPPSYLGNFPPGYGHHANGLANSTTNHSPTTPPELAALLNEVRLQQVQYASQQEGSTQGQIPSELMQPVICGALQQTCNNEPQFQVFAPNVTCQNPPSPPYTHPQQTQFSPQHISEDQRNTSGGGNFPFIGCFQVDPTNNFQAQSSVNFELSSIPTPPWEPIHQINQNPSDTTALNAANFGYFNGYVGAHNGNGEHTPNPNPNEFNIYSGIGMTYGQGRFNQYENYGPSSNESIHANNENNQWQYENGFQFDRTMHTTIPIYDQNGNGHDKYRNDRRNHNNGGGGRRRRNHNSNKSRQGSAENGNGNGYNNSNMRHNHFSSQTNSCNGRAHGDGYSAQRVNNGNGTVTGRKYQEQDFSSYCENPDSPESLIDSREVGIVDKLLHSYGFIRCPVTQSRLFFHFSHFEGNVEHLKQGDTVEFDRTYDRKTAKPVAANVVKLSASIMKDEGTRLIGIVTSELTSESNGKLRGRISYEYNGECFFLPYGAEDLKNKVPLSIGDTVSFQIEIKNRNGGLKARYVQLECSAKCRLYNGFVTCVLEDFGFIQRVDVPKKIYFHFSEIRFTEEIEVGDYIEFNIRTENGQEAATNLNKVCFIPQVPNNNTVGARDPMNMPLDDQAEARLAARRQARAEAREIRMRELEKQQKDTDDNADKQYDMYSSDVVNRAAFRVAIGNHRSQGHSIGSASYHSSRRSSEDSSEDGMVSLRDMRHELKELEDKFRKSMVQNAQLDNEKSALTYQVELLKDKIEDIEENMAQLQREHKEKCREYENLKRISAQLKLDLECCKAQLQEKDDLIKDYGLVVVESEVEVDIGNGERETRIKRNLVTQQSADVLSTLGTGSLDVRLKKVMEENNDLQDEIRRLKLDLEEERNHSRGGYSSHNSVNNHAQNGPEEDFELQREASKIVAEYKFKVQKYEQEIATLQANVARLDGQVTRFKTASEEAESREDDLKVDKRKLQRELREAQSRLDELETTNSHLQKRLDKLKTAKSTLLKEL